MSQQTFVKKDKISFAVNSNEIVSITPVANTIYFGDTNTNSNTSVILSNQYIYADGTYISNLPPGNISVWANFPAINDINVNGSNILNANVIYSAELRTTNVLTDSIYAPNGIGNINVRNTIDMQNNNIGNINTLLFNNGSSQNTSADNIVQSTIVGLGTFGYISSGTGLTQINLTSTIVGLGTFGYVSSLDSISTNNLSSGNLFADVISSLQFNASSINANTAGIDRLTGANNGFGTYTNNLYPATTSAVIGFDAGNFVGWYSNIWARQVNSISTNTNIIGSATGAGNIGSTVRVLGTLSSQNQVASSITTNILFGISNISTNRITTQFLQGSGQFGNLVYTSILLPSGSASIGNAPINTYTSVWGTNIYTNTIQPVLSAGDINSTVRILGTLSSQNARISSITIVDASILNLSSFFYGGIEKYNYISTNTVPSTIDGLGSFGYISSTQLTSTVVGLGNIYLSSGGATQVSINSTIIGLGSFGYLSTNIVPSTIDGLGSFGYLSTNIVPSTIIGLGSFGYLSTNIVPSTIDGLGSFGYISSTQLVSTVIGLGNIYISTASGSASDWSLYPAITDVNLSYNIIDTVQQINVDTISSATSGFIDIINRVNLQQNRIAGVNDLQTDSISANNYGTVRFDNTIDMNTNNINNANTITTENITSLGGTVTVYSHLIPLADDSYDLGSATNRWKKLYVGGTSIHLGTQLVLSEDIDGKLSTNAITVSSINVGNISTGTISADIINNFSTNVSTIITNNVAVRGVNPLLYFYGLNDQETPLGAITAVDGFGFGIISPSNINILSPGGNIGIQALNGSAVIEANNFLFLKGDTQVQFQTPLINADTTAFISTIATNNIVSATGKSNIDIETEIVNISSLLNVSSINTNFISTNSINLNTIQTEYITSAGGTVSTTSHLIPSFDDTYDLGSATNRWRELYVAGTSIHLGNTLILSEDIDGKLSTNKGIIAPGLNLDNNAISNVLQIKHISSATTNLCLPTYKLITTTNPNTYNDSAFIQILVNPNYFTHVIPFDKYRVQLNFNALLDTPTTVSYFYFTLSNYNSTVYPGSLYSATRPYSYIQAFSSNTAFNFTDVFDMSATPPNIGDSLYVLLYAKNYDNVNISYSNVNCFVVTEPVV